MAYKCSKCGLGVIVIPDKKLIKACECAAPITMEMSAVTKGHGGIKVVKK